MTQSGAIDVFQDEVGHLEYEPGRDEVSDGNAKNVAALQFVEELTQSIVPASPCRVRV